MTASKPGRIAVVGSNMVDLVTYITRMPAPGETIEAPDFEIGCGGKGANQAVAAAKLGSAVSMVTKVGDDIFGENTRRNLAQHGIDIRHVETVAGKSSGVAPIFVEASGENSIPDREGRECRPFARRCGYGRRDAARGRPDPDADGGPARDGDPYRAAGGGMGRAHHPEPRPGRGRPECG